MNRLADLRALNAARHEAALEAGNKAAFGAAAMVAAVAVGSTLYEQTASPSFDPLPVPNTDAERRADIEQMLLVDAPDIEAVEPELLAAAFEVVQPVSLSVAPETLPIITGGVREQIEQRSPFVSATPFTDMAIQLEHREPFVREAEAHAPTAPQQDALEALADDIGRDYESADASVRDVSLFVAADDEALSWSLTEASPNFGALAYEDERVDVGNLAVGVALNLENARIAAAYVEREVDTRMNARFGEASRDQNFVGAIVTLKM